MEIIWAAMGIVAREHMFCSALKCETWYELIVGELEDVENEEDAVEDEEAQSQRIALLEVEAKELQYVQAPRI